MRRILLLNMASMILVSISQWSGAAEYQVAQQNKAFSLQSMTIKKGDKVHFINNDPFFHNVFSLSDTQFFDLGSYPKGESRSIIFKQTGTLDVECAIHPTMKMSITVTE